MGVVVTVPKTGNPDIDGLLYGYKWSGAITYSFPDSATDYNSIYYALYGDGELAGFRPIPVQEQVAINYAVALVKGYTNLSIVYAGTNSADIMVGQSSTLSVTTSYAYLPSNLVLGGDVWFGTSYDYSQASPGNYQFQTALHEFGHALGLKHSFLEAGMPQVAVPAAHDCLEYTIMSYSSYAGSTAGGYTNEKYGYPTTYMMDDILALQTMYGANYSLSGQSITYSWSQTTGQEFINGVAQLAPGGGIGGSANRIFETIWNEGATTTYDLSNYTTGLTINLNPGAYSVFSTTQLAYLGDDHYAAGNVYNAYLYNNDPRSYIANAIGGSGNDTIIGNAMANILIGGAGNDTITGGLGDDYMDGGDGIDTFIFSGTRAQYSIVGDVHFATVVGPDGHDTVVNGEYLKFDDQIVPLVARTVTQAVAGGSSDTTFDALSNRLAVAYHYTDGSSVVYQYDALSQFAWTTVTATYNSKGERTQATYANDDGTQSVYQYDVGNAFDWSQIQSKYNVAGQREQVIYTNDDGTMTVYQYDVGNAFSWSQIKTSFNASGQTVTVVYTNDDHTSVLYQYDVDGIYSWSKQARYFDAAGHKTKDVFDNDNGTHTLIEYDINGYIINTKSYGGVVVAAGQSEGAVSDVTLAATASLGEQQALAVDVDQASHASSDFFVFRADTQFIHQTANFVASAATNSAALADLVSESHSAIAQLLAHLVSHDEGQHNNLQGSPSLVPHDADASLFHLTDLVARGFLTH